MAGVETDNVRLPHEQRGSRTVCKAPAFNKHTSKLHCRAKSLRTSLLQRATKLRISIPMLSPEGCLMEMDAPAWAARCTIKKIFF